MSSATDAPFEVRAVRLAHALNASFLVATFSLAIAGHEEGPARIPLHFDLAGNPDRWGENSWGKALAVPLVALGITALVYWSTRIVDWARRHPALLNLPNKEAFLALPPALQEPIWRQLKALSYWLAVPETLLFLTLVALRPGEDGRLTVWPIFVPLALVPVIVGALTVRLVRRVSRVAASASVGRDRR